MDRLQELVRLHRMKTRPREVARLLAMSPNTERMYRLALDKAGLLGGAVEQLPELEVLKRAVLDGKPLPSGPTPQHASSLEPWRAHVMALVDKGLGARATYDRLRLDYGEFAASYSAVKRFYRSEKRAKGVSARDVALPVETEPGEVGQVDFGYVGLLFDPATQTLRRAWCFVMVLGYSRHMVARLVFDQKVETWLRVHVEAWRQLGGVLRTVVPDNLKSAVVRAAFSLGQMPELNRSYRELARHYGFKIDPTPPYDPRKKGKVESGVKYVKNNALRGRQKQPIDEVQRALDRWVREVAGQREHGTTGRRPLEVFEQIERARLVDLPALNWEPVVWHKAKVHTDCHVCFERRLYSVPWRLVGQEVWLRATPTSVVVYANDERVATHSRCVPGLRSTQEQHLPEGRRDLCHRSRAYWQQRAEAIGPEPANLVHEVFEADEVLSQLRTVQAIVTHLEGFPLPRARAACARALYYGNLSYKGVKNILKKALDQQPLPTAAVPSGVLAAPRFARPMRDLLAPVMENRHEPHG